MIRRKVHGRIGALSHKDSVQVTDYDRKRPPDRLATWRYWNGAQHIARSQHRQGVESSLQRHVLRTLLPAGPVPEMLSCSCKFR
jgi:hypothetical protein